MLGTLARAFSLRSSRLTQAHDEEELVGGEPAKNASEGQSPEEPDEEYEEDGANESGAVNATARKRKAPKHDSQSPGQSPGAGGAAELASEKGYSDQCQYTVLGVVLLLFVCALLVLVRKVHNPITSMQQERLEGLFAGTTKLKMPYDVAMFSPKYLGTNPRVHNFPTCGAVEDRMKNPSLAMKVKKEKESAQNFSQHVMSLEEPPLPFDKDTRGIVITCVPDEQLVANLHLLLYTHKTTLPIELWLQRQTLRSFDLPLLRQLYGDRLTFRYFEDLEEKYINATTTLEYRSKKHPGKKYFYKLMAIAMSRFQKVLYLDKDLFLVQSPDRVINTCERVAKETGAIFWRDVFGICDKNPIWDMLEVPKMRGYSQESGIVYLDKGITWRALFLIAYMNQKQDVYYNLLHGDKETFFLAFEKLKMKYHFVPYAPYLVGCNTNKRRGAYSLVQPDINGEPMAVHLVSGKGRVLSAAAEYNEFFTTVWAYDGNNHNVNGALRALPNQANKETSTLNPAEKYIGNFADVFTTYYNLGLDIMRKKIQPIDPDEDTPSNLIDTLSDDGRAPKKSTPNSNNQQPNQK